jgi:hypothetical protein
VSEISPIKVSIIISPVEVIPVGFTEPIASAPELVKARAPIAELSSDPAAIVPTSFNALSKVTEPEPFQG